MMRAPPELAGDASVDALRKDWPAEKPPCSPAVTGDSGGDEQPPG